MNWLRGWTGPVRVNGVLYESGGQAVDAARELSGRVVLDFTPGAADWVVGETYRVEVLPYMCRAWAFHTEWNRGVPMPAVHYTGRCTKVTAGMVHFEGAAWSGWVIKKAVVRRESAGQ